jgi:hypothetical protein
MIGQSFSALVVPAVQCHWRRRHYIITATDSCPLACMPQCCCATTKHDHIMKAVDAQHTLTAQKNTAVLDCHPLEGADDASILRHCDNLA